MKYFVKSKMYKAANVSYDTQTGTAWSYGWWAFVKVIKGRVVFNAYRYSVSTAKHQSKVRGLLRELGVKIDRTVQVAEGLQGINTLAELNAAEKKTLAHLAEAAENKRQRRLKAARERRAARKAKAAANETPAKPTRRENRVLGHLRLIPGGLS